MEAMVWCAVPPAGHEQVSTSVGISTTFARSYLGHTTLNLVLQKWVLFSSYILIYYTTI